ncbi:MAG: apolipoprotein N-acyltransferase [Glaciecola sp.]
MAASPVFGYPVLSLLPLALLSLAIWPAAQKLRVIHTFGLGWIAGLGYAGALFYWLSGINAAGAVITIAGFACLPGLFAVGIQFALTRGLSGVSFALWFASLWTSLEFVGSDNIAPLPPYGLGYFWWEYPMLLQSAAWVSAYGASFVLALGNATIALAIRRHLTRPTLALFLACSTGLIVIGAISFAGAPSYDSAPERHLTIAALRTLRSGEEKRDPQTLLDLVTLTDSLTDITKNARPGLVVWPETAIPLSLRSYRNRELITALLEQAKSQNAPMLVGAHSIEVVPGEAPRLYNAAFLIPSSGYINQEYHKILLAPGVEKTLMAPYLPPTLAERWPSRLQTGNTLGLFNLDDHKIGVFICWEVFFPDFVRQLAQQGAGVLINMSNDNAAFGDAESAYTIPLPHVVLRAIENQRYVVRSANGGPSIAVDPYGRVAAIENGAQESILLATVNLQSRNTFFSRHGAVIAGILTVGTLIWGLLLTMAPRRLT